VRRTWVEFARYEISENPSNRKRGTAQKGTLFSKCH